VTTRDIHRLACALLLSVAAAGLHAAAVDPDLPNYQPVTLEAPKGARYLTADGAIAVVGYNDMRHMLERQVALFEASHPGIRISLDLPGTRFAPAALARERSALAPMGAEFTPTQLADYRSVTGSDPIEIRVAHASLEPGALSGPLAIFVHRDNPIGMLTLEQLARAYAGKARRWGDLGVHGDWAARPIHLYGVERGTPLALFMQKAGLGGQSFANRITEFHQSADVVRHMSEDPLAIGFAAAMRTMPSVRALPLARRTGEEPVALTEESIMTGRYPLDRHLLIYVRRPLTPFVREFLRLALSREGQEAVAAAPEGYLPLSAQEAAIERAKLD